jgi:hypothetical protein
MFEKQFEDDGMAHTLRPEDVCEGFYDDPLRDRRIGDLCTRTHADGWTISGKIKEDWYYWVNDFEANHPVFGRVWGNFESTVFADSEEAYDAFCAAHSPFEWDYGDI